MFGPSILRGAAAITLLTLGMTCAQAGGLRLTLYAPATVYTGTTYSFTGLFEKETPGDGIVHHGPFTLRVELPNGMTLRPANTGNGWSCAAPPPATRTMSCTYSGDLNNFNPGSSGVGINADTSAGMALGPTSLKATIESSEVPLAPVPTCAASPSVTGCALAAPTVVASSLQIADWGYTSGFVNDGQIGVWTGPPYEAGAQGSLVVGVRNTGFGPSNTPVTLRISMPPGVTYAFTASSLPSWTCTPQMQAGSQLLTCTTPYMIDGQYGYVSLATHIAYEVAIPGPIYFHAALGNNVLPPPTDCVANPTQIRCGRLQMPTRVPRTAYLRFAAPDVTHSPNTFVLGQDAGPIVVNFQNIGDGTATATSLVMKLPPGFGYASTLSASPPLTCNSSGNLASGQILSCSGVGLPPGFGGQLSFVVHVDAATETPGPLPLVGAIDTASPASTTTLNACIADPNHANCFWHEIPTFAPCALQYGADGIYCDGFHTALPH